MPFGADCIVDVALVLALPPVLFIDSSLGDDVTARRLDRVVRSGAPNCAARKPARNSVLPHAFGWPARGSDWGGNGQQAGWIFFIRVISK
ncbi:MAG: hypothetical protein ABIU96_01905 [Rhodanobacter sp.]